MTIAKTTILKVEANLNKALDALIDIEDKLGHKSSFRDAIHAIRDLQHTFDL